MDHLVWDESFSVGVAELDRHHRRLAELINQLADSQARSAHSEAVSDILNALSDYADRHFAYEERILADYGYPDLEEQESEHLEFCEVVADACYQATCGELDLEALLHYLQGWWGDHILEIDFKYRPFFASHGVR